MRQDVQLYFDGGHVEIAVELIHELDADGKQPRVVKLAEYTVPRSRKRVVAIQMRGGEIKRSTPPRKCGHSAPARTSTQCLHPMVAVRKHLPGVLKILPIGYHNNMNKIIGKFGPPGQLRNAVNQLQSLLYAA